MHLSKIMGIEAKTAATNALLVVNPLVWYYIVIIFLQDALAKMSLNSSESTLIWGLHFSAIIIAALVGAPLTKKIEKRLFLILWMILGVVSPIALYWVNTASMPIIGLLVLLLGVSFGIGMPACMGFYTNGIPIEKRGRISGVVMLFTFLGIFTLGNFAISNPLIIGPILSVWRLLALLTFLTMKSPKEEHNVDTTSYRHILNQHSFSLYFIPWVMFSLVNYIAAPFQVSLVGADTAAIMKLIQSAFMATFALVGGFLLDFIGRKRIAIVGFVMLGIGAASLGIYPENVLAGYFNAVVDGIAWGFLFVLFILTLWGDLSYSSSSSKYYAIGVLPFFFSKFLEVTMGSYIAELIPPESGSGLFSFLSFFLFLAVLPLVYAPETLPEKTMKDRDLKSYTEKALKQAQKDAGKSKKKDSDKAEEEKEEAEESPEDEEARKLAEKYY